MQIRGWKEERRRERQEIEGENDVMESKWGRGEKVRERGRESKRKRSKRMKEGKCTIVMNMHEVFSGLQS